MAELVIGCCTTGLRFMGGGGKVPRLLLRRVHPPRRPHCERLIESRIPARGEIRRPERRNGDRRWDPGDVEVCAALGEIELVGEAKDPPVRQATVRETREHSIRVLS